MATSTMTYDERLDALRSYLAESDRVAMGVNGNLDHHNCRLDHALQELLVCEATQGADDVEITKRSDFVVRSVAVMVLLASMPGNRIMSGILSQCAAEGIMRYVEFPNFLTRLHKMVHEEEVLFVQLLRDEMDRG